MTFEESFNAINSTKIYVRVSDFIENEASMLMIVFRVDKDRKQYTWTVHPVKVDLEILPNGSKCVTTTGVPAKSQRIYQSEYTRNTTKSQEEFRKLLDYDDIERIVSIFGYKDAIKSISDSALN